MASLLLVDDDPGFARAALRTLAGQPLIVSWAKSCAEARAILGTTHARPLDYAVIDDRLGDGSGLGLLPLLDTLRPPPAVALVSAYLSAGRAIAALRARADCLVLPKPKEPSEVLELLALLERRHPTRGGRALAFGHFVLEAQSLGTPDGFIALLPASFALLHFLVHKRSDAFSHAADVARELYGRRDRAGQDLVRRHVADLRRSLGPYAWILESVPKRGYRISPDASGAPAGRV